jgi:hypothetical protein
MGDPLGSGVDAGLRRSEPGILPKGAIDGVSKRQTVAGPNDGRGPQQECRQPDAGDRSQDRVASFHGLTG